MICAVELQIKVCGTRLRVIERIAEVCSKRPGARKSPRHAEQRQKYSTCRGSFRLSRLLLLVLKEIRHSYCWLTTVQVVEWPELEPLGQLENVCPFLKNITTVVCVLHLYGPDF